MRGPWTRQVPSARPNAAHERLDETTGAATITIRLRIVSAELGRSQVREL